MEYIGKEIRQQASLRIVHALNIRNHAECDAVPHRADYCIQSDIFKIFSEWFRSNPMISQEHHRLFAITMYDIYQFFSQFTDFYLLEFHKVSELLRGHSENGIVISFIHDKFRTELIACPFFELFQNIRADTRTVTEPLYILFSFFIIEGKRKLMEKGRKTHNIHMWILLTPFFQFSLHVSLRFRLSHIVSKLMGRILPVVRNKIIHMYRVPDQESQKTDGILMIRNRFNNHLARCFLILPLCSGYDLSCCSVNYFPPPFGRIYRIYLELFRMKTLHQFYADRISFRRHAVADQIFLLYFFRIFHSPVIVFSGRIISRVYFSVLTKQFFRHRRPITIPQSIRSEQFL